MSQTELKKSAGEEEGKEWMRKEEQEIKKIKGKKWRQKREKQMRKEEKWKKRRNDVARENDKR